MDKRARALQTAYYLAVVTIAYNIIEGLVSIYYGISDETLSLLGFGIDSLVEVISGAGILHMVIKLRKNGDETQDRFEKNALRVTGLAFFLLAAGLLVGAVLNITQENAPETTIPGVVISIISILTMYFLMKAKLNIGRKLNSDAIIADAMCTKTCFYLSIILLASSIFYEIFRISYIDVAGSLGIAYFAVKEGIEAFQKAAGKSTCCCADHCRQEKIV